MLKLQTDFRFLNMYTPEIKHTHTSHTALNGVCAQHAKAKQTLTRAMFRIQIVDCAIQQNTHYLNTLKLYIFKTIFVSKIFKYRTM